MPPKKKPLRSKPGSTTAEDSDANSSVPKPDTEYKHIVTNEVEKIYVEPKQRKALDWRAVTCDHPLMHISEEIINMNLAEAVLSNVFDLSSVIPISAHVDDFKFAGLIQFLKNSETAHPGFINHLAREDGRKLKVHLSIENSDINAAKLCKWTDFLKQHPLRVSYNVEHAPEEDYHRNQFQGQLLAVEEATDSEEGVADVIDAVYKYWGLCRMGRGLDPALNPDWSEDDP